MNKILKNYLLYMVYEVVALVVPLFTAPYLTRTLLAENYGIYSYVFSATSLIMTISLAGLYTYGNRQTAYDREDPQALSRMFWELMALRMICGVLGSAAFFLYGFLTGYGAYFGLFFCFYLANVLDVSWFFVGTENMMPCTVKNVLSKLAMCAGTFLFVRDERDVGIYLLVVAIPTLVANLAIYPLVFRRIGFRPHIDGSKLWHHFRGSFLLCLPTMVAQLYLQVDKIMLEWLTGGTAQVSFYDQAEKIVVLPLSVITALGTVMMPRLANEFATGDTKGLSRHMGLTGRFYLMLALPMMAGIASVALWTIPWYLGEEYMPTAYVLMLLAPYVLLNAMGNIAYQYFIATDRPKFLLYSNLISAGVNLCLNAMFIPLWGCYGAAVATVIANLVSVVVQYAVMGKDLSLREMFGSSWRYWLGSGLLCGAVLGLGFGLGWTARPWVTVVLVAVGMVVYLICLVVTREPWLKTALQLFKKKKN